MVGSVFLFDAEHRTRLVATQRLVVGVCLRQTRWISPTTNIWFNILPILGTFGLENALKNNTEKYLYFPQKGVIIILPNQLNNLCKGYFYLYGIVIPFFIILILNLLKMQIPTEYGEDYIVLAVSVGLATIGVCVFGAVASVAALFY